MGERPSPAETGVTFDGRCFGCGPDNHDGLHLVFEHDAEAGTSTARFTVPPRFQSWGGMTHGGIVALLLDEAVGWAAWHAGSPGVTGKLEVRYRRPLPIGAEVTLTGRVIEVRRRLVRATAAAETTEDGLIAEASATLMATPVRIP